MTPAQFTVKFEKHVRDKYPSVNRAAKAYCVSRRQLYLVFDMKAKPNEYMLNDIGLRRTERVIIKYVEVGQ